MGQNPTVPVYRGEIQTRNLGMAVEAWSLDGECVCLSAWVGGGGWTLVFDPTPSKPTVCCHSDSTCGAVDKSDPRSALQPEQSEP